MTKIVSLIFLILGLFSIFPKSAFALAPTTLELFMVNPGEENTFVETLANIDDRPTFSNTGIYNYSVTLKDSGGNPVVGQPIKIIDRATGLLINIRCFNSATAKTPQNCPPTTTTAPYLPVTDDQGKARFNINFTASINKPVLMYAVFEGSDQYAATTSNKSSLKIGTTSQWCYYGSYEYSQPQNNNGLNKRLVINKTCKPSGSSNTYTVAVDLNVGDSFSKGEVKPCVVNNSSQQCVLGNFKYYYDCHYTKCPQITVNYSDPSIPLACNNPIEVCGESQQVCSGTKYDSPSGTLVMPIRTQNGNPAIGADPIQVACYSAVTESEANSTIRAWEVASLGYAQSENNRAQVYPVACIDDNDCKVSESCDRSGSWNQWACKPKQFSRPVRVFVTSNRYDANLGGLAGADAKCKAEADASSIVLMRGNKWKAWISDSTVNAKDRISDGTYALPDYTRVANTKSQLISGNFVKKITKNANGTTVGVLSDDPEGGRVWTGTKANGEHSDKTCANWNLPEAAYGVFGLFSSNGQNWTEAGATGCSQRPEVGVASFRLYCFEDLTPDNTSVNAACQTGTSTRTEVQEGLISVPGTPEKPGLKGSFSNNIGYNNAGACIINDPQAAFVSHEIPTFSDLLAVHFTRAKIGSDKKLIVPADANPDPNQGVLTFDTKPLIHIQRNLNISGDPPSASKGPGVVFIDGNLNISQNYLYGKTSTNDASGTVFVVKRNVVIDASVTEVNAVIIAQGTIYTAGDGCDTSSVGVNSPLIINGSLISINDPFKDATADTSGIKFCRVLNINPNNTLASEKINLQPKYLSILRNLFSTSIQKWAEIPGFKKILANQPVIPEPAAPGSTAASFRRMFVTKDKYPSNLSINGGNSINGASAKCQVSADQAGLGGKWKAWLAYAEFVDIDNSTGSPDYWIAKNDVSEIQSPKLPIKLINGSSVVNDPAKLFDGSSNSTSLQNKNVLHYIPATILDNPINIDQYGNTITGPERVWTNISYWGQTGYSHIGGAAGGGQEVTIRNANCALWRGVNGSGATGRTDTKTDQWTDSWNDGLIPCTSTAHLYCYEVF